LKFEIRRSEMVIRGVLKRIVLALGLAAVAMIAAGQTSSPSNTPTTTTGRPRARELGVVVGVLPTGPLNAITDVEGVLVGQTTVIRGENVRTGVTAVVPHGGNLFTEKVPGAVFVGNGFGKLIGSTQVEELGEIESPILLTSTLNVPKVGDALIDYMLAQQGQQEVRTVNVVVGETNDGYLSDIRGRHVGRDEVFAALKSAKGRPVEEGSIGAGTGTVCFGWKGGIGTSSRKLPDSLGGFTVGVLVQTNYGGVLTINGAPIGVELGKYYLKDEVAGKPRARVRSGSPKTDDNADGSVMVVIATDAPVEARQLKRMGARAMMGIARTGSSASNGSGDYAIAFSTAKQNRIYGTAKPGVRNTQVLANDAMSPLFQAVIEATEEAVYNSLFKATTVTGNGHTVEALPIEQTVEILRRHNALSTPGKAVER
jgi:D-aminopeptidase